MKRFFIAAAFAATVAMGLPSAAEADTKVRIYLGMPHYGYQVGPDYRFRSGYGWYRPVGINRGRLSCGRSQTCCAQQWVQECPHH